MYRSCESSAVTSARVSTVWMNVPGSAVRQRAAWIVRASSAAVRADSLPPFRIAALPVRVSSVRFVCVSDCATLKSKNDRAARDCRRTGFESEGGNVDDDFGTCFEDDEEHADRTGNAVEIEVVV